jgi:hypothetical protein
VVRFSLSFFFIFIFIFINDLSWLAQVLDFFLGLEPTKNFSLLGTLEHVLFLG